MSSMQNAAGAGCRAPRLEVDTFACGVVSEPLQEELWRRGAAGLSCDAREAGAEPENKMRKHLRLVWGELALSFIGASDPRLVPGSTQGGAGSCCVTGKIQQRY